MIHNRELKAIIFLFMNITLLGEMCQAQESNYCYADLSQVLDCFIKHEDGAFGFEENKDDLQHENLKSYFLKSQIWPIYHDDDIQSATWEHKLKIFIPKKLVHDTALLFVACGYNYNDKGFPQYFSPKENLDYQGIADENNAIVSVIEDVPNQYLKMAGTLKKEDQILAYTYKKVMQDPFKNAYLAGHLPMTKAVIKAMDAIQIILKDKGVLVNNFVLTGASKRGWAVWLAAISDERVSAIIPIVIDILNVQKNINLICSSYGGICPPAFRDYADEGITNYLQSQEFSKLMEIEDPYSYINNKKYEPRFKIPKYIINSSGDDFYVADSSSLYFKSLPGEKFIRFLPEGMHYIAGNPISNYIGNIKTLNDEISDFFYFHLNNSNLPLVSWSFEDDIIEVNSSIAPIKITLWQAHNKKIKDFRCINSYEKSNLYWKIGLIYLYETFGLKEPICNTEFKPKELQINCDKDCNFKIDTIVRNSGWHASFVELIYNINGKNFTVTTEMLVTKKDN